MPQTLWPGAWQANKNVTAYDSKNTPSDSADERQASWPRPGTGWWIPWARALPKSVSWEEPLTPRSTWHYGTLGSSALPPCVRRASEWDRTLLTSWCRQRRGQRRATNPARTKDTHRRRQSERELKLFQVIFNFRILEVQMDLVIRGFLAANLLIHIWKIGLKGQISSQNVSFYLWI